MKEIKGPSLGARPTIADPNDIFIDLSTGNRYVFEDGEWESVPQTPSPKLPAVTSSDNGKVLKVSSGKWNKGDAPTELPAVTAEDNGDVLTVVSGSWAKAAPAVELPAVTAEDAGKVLTVSAEGTWVAAALPTRFSK